MYLYPTTYLITGDSIKVPTPNAGTYHIVVGREPSHKAKPKHDNFHWRLAVKHNSADLSRRAVKISVKKNGFICVTAIGKNDVVVRLSDSRDYTLKPGNSTIWLDPKDCYNLQIKIAGVYTLKTQSVAGGTNIPFHIHSLTRQN